VGLPNFLCIGAQKAGTSWLDQMIRQHPDLWMPPIKELQFFNHMFVESDRRWTEWAVKNAVRRHLIRCLQRAQPLHVNYPYIRYVLDIGSRDLFTEAWYRRIFDRPQTKGKLIGEISPGYCTIPSEGIRYLYRMLRSARIIYIIRDPVTRALSQLRMEVSMRRRPPSTEAEWFAYVEKSDVERRSDYARFVPLWQSTFPTRQLLFLPYGDIAADPASVLRRVEIFLGLRSFGNYKGLHSKFHETTPVAFPSGFPEFLGQRMTKQQAFLQSFFGDDFAARAAPPVPAPREIEPAAPDRQTATATVPTPLPAVDAGGQPARAKINMATSNPTGRMG
jgi:Sulfotransferase family